MRSGATSPRSGPRQVTGRMVSSEPLFPGDAPLSDRDVWGLGYEPGPRGWRLVDAEVRSDPDPLLCRACGLFRGVMADRLCPGCFYYGGGDPHGLALSDFQRWLDEMGKRR
jgi:hypothetical protein